jgi:hypothetical protein
MGGSGVYHTSMQPADIDHGITVHYNIPVRIELDIIVGILSVAIIDVTSNIPKPLFWKLGPKLGEVFLARL